MEPQTSPQHKKAQDAETGGDRPEPRQDGTAAEPDSASQPLTGISCNRRPQRKRLEVAIRPSPKAWEEARSPQPSPSEAPAAAFKMAPSPSEQSPHSAETEDSSPLSGSSGEGANTPEVHSNPRAGQNTGLRQVSLKGRGAGNLKMPAPPTSHPQPVPAAESPPSPDGDNGGDSELHSEHTPTRAKETEPTRDKSPRNLRPKEDKMALAPHTPRHGRPSSRESSASDRSSWGSGVPPEHGATPAYQMKPLYQHLDPLDLNRRSPKGSTLSKNTRADQHIQKVTETKPHHLVHQTTGARTAMTTPTAQGQ